MMPIGSSILFFRYFECAASFGICVVRLEACLKTEKQAPKFLNAEWGKTRTAENGGGLCCFTEAVNFSVSMKEKSFR